MPSWLVERSRGNPKSIDGTAYRRPSCSTLCHTMKTIFAVGIDVPSDGLKYVQFDSDTSLLDADIVVFNPDMSGMYGYGYDHYQGKPCLSDHASFELKERLDHWRRELNEATNAGKTVFVILTEKQEVFVDSGQREYSGTGRNARTTRLVAPCTNYDCVPGGLIFTPCTGEAMRLADKAELLADYWRQMAARSYYKVTIDGKVSQRLVVSKDSTRTLGALLHWKETLGNMILLPATSFDDEDLTETKPKDLRWTKKAIAIGAQMVACLLAIDETLRSDREITPIPSWVRTPGYDLPRERELKADLLRVEGSMRQLADRKAGILKDIRQEGMLKHLLYEKGKALEHSIVVALTTLGFHAAPYRHDGSEFDVVFASKEGRLLGEAEGKDNKIINVDKLRQLEMNIHEDYEREGVTDMAKGVLFGNAYRLTPLSERGDYFTEKCVTAASRSSTALVRTPDLFFVAQYLSTCSDEEYARKCRECILAASGSVVTFPRIPEQAKAESVGKET